MSWYIIAAIGVVVIGIILALWIFKVEYPEIKHGSIIFGIALIIAILLVIIPRLIPSFCSGKPAPTSGAPECVSGTLNIDGSTAMQPLISDVAKDYMKRCSVAKIQVSGGGSLKGLEDVESNNTVQIADSDIPTPSGLYQDLEDHKVVVALFVLIVNKSTGITNLTIGQIQNIYNGNYKNWSQLGHTFPDLPITAISRDANSGTRATFGKYVLNGSREQGVQIPSDSTDAVISQVENTPGAIGYVSLYNALLANQITILNIDGHPYSDYSNNDYKFWNVEHMYTKGEPSPHTLAKAFIAYMGNEDVVKNTITTDSFISINDNSLSGVLNNHCSS